MTDLSDVACFVGCQRLHSARLSLLMFFYGRNKRNVDIN